jgi:hypothetical protein
MSYHRQDALDRHSSGRRGKVGEAVEVASLTALAVVDAQSRRDAPQDC